MNKIIEVVKKIYRNKPQIIAFIINATYEIIIWGRGTGKSSTRVAERSSDCAMSMAQSKGAFVSDTLANLKRIQLPPIIAGWKQLGYIQDVDFFIEKKPDRKKFDWWEPAPDAPLEDKNVIFWINGSYQLLFGLDKNFNNGASLDYMLLLEAKNIKHEKFKEVILTVRGNREKFKDNHLHESLTIETDMPTDPKGYWVLEYEYEMDNDVIKAIWLMAKKIFFLEKAAEEKQDYFEQHPKAKRINELQLNRLHKTLTELRKAAVFVSFASSIDNIGILGKKTIKRWRLSLTDLQFRTSVLGRRMKKAEKIKSFYTSFNEDIHTYRRIDYDYIESLKGYDKVHERNCLWYNDTNLDQPLSISCDYNNKINWIVVGQWKNEDKYRIVSSMYSLKELDESLTDAIQKFCNFYKYRENKTVRFIYDHTGKQGPNAVNDLVFYEEVIRVLRANDWNVIEDYIGHCMNHNSRFLFFDSIFSGKEKRFPSIEINQDTNADLITSINMAEVYQGQNGFAKSKASESSGIVPPENATHGSEAFDTLITGEFRNNITNNGGYFGF